MGCLKAIGVLIGLALIAVIGFWLGYPRIYPTYKVRYRTTVRVSIDQQVRSGSSVVELRVATQPRLLDNPPIALHLTGEATFVDLGDGRNLVAQLRYPLILSAFGMRNLANDAGKLPNLRGERPVPASDLPKLVTFADPSDPLSVETVDPKSFSETFGSNARFENVTISITNDPVTHDIEQKLPWLNGPPRDRSDPQRTAMVRARLGRPYFIRNDP